MSTTVAADTVTISMEAGCDYASCARFANERFHQLNVPKYTHGMSILRCPDTLEQWRAEHRTARKRADRCHRLGYRVAEIDRSKFNDDIHEINTSLAMRQGRPMSDGYVNRHNHGRLPDYPCARHRIHIYGILQGDWLRAYLSLYRVGELGLVSMILGHGAHLRDEIMYLLAQGVILEQLHHGGFFFYNRHDSGTDGLRFYKERIGFRETDIEWSLA